MKGTRAKAEIESFLTGTTKTTQEIKDHINAKYKHGVSMGVLANMLGKGGKFEHTGKGWKLRSEEE